MDWFQLHDNTKRGYAAHVKETLVNYQEELNIQLTSASIGEIPNHQYFNKEVPLHEIHIREAAPGLLSGHVHIQTNQAAHQALNKDEGLIERITATIVNIQNDYYQLPTIPDNLTRDNPAEKNLIDTYKRITDSLTHRVWFGQVSNKRYLRNVLLPRIRSRNNLIRSLDTQENPHVEQQIREQRTDYADALVSGATNLARNGLYDLAKHTALNLQQLIEKDLSPAERLEALIAHASHEQVTVDPKQTQRAEKIITTTKKHELYEPQGREAQKYLQTLSDDFLDLLLRKP